MSILIFAGKETFASYGHYTFARLSYVKGDVYLQRAADLGYEEGVVNMPISEGDRLGTTEGQVEVYLGKRNYLRLDHYTKVDFLNLPGKGYDFLAFNLWAGNIYLSINYLERDRNFEIKTPDATFYILEEGLYRINVNEGGETELFVINGLVEAIGEEGSLLVRSEQEIELVNGQFVSRPRYFTFYARDDFDQWNQYRESEINRRVANRYLPAELDEYAWELNYYGRWVYQSPYGYVWVPVVIDYGWRPYYYGRWIWLPLCGWTWVPYEPWGWCVYHYGRWHWSASLGWYWIPTTIWGPAWVYWYWGIDYIGWGPLSYYGYPVVVVNNYCYVRGYYNSIPVNSRATVFIHKNQLRARNVSKVALSHNELSRTIKLSKISISKQQPTIKPVSRKLTTSMLNGKKVLLKKDVARTEFKELRSINSQKIKRTSPSQKYSSPTSKTISRFKKPESTTRRIPSSTSSRERKIIKKDYEYYSPSNKSNKYSISREQSERKIKLPDYSRSKKNYLDRSRLYRYYDSSSKSEKRVYSSKSRSFLSDLYNRFSKSKTITSSKKSYSKSSSSFKKSSPSRTISRTTSRRSSSSSSRLIKKKK